MEHISLNTRIKNNKITIVISKKNESNEWDTIKYIKIDETGDVKVYNIQDKEAEDL